jgi:outer membrane protein
VKKVQIATDLKSAGSKLGTIKVDPVVFGIGLGYKF